MKRKLLILIFCAALCIGMIAPIHAATSVTDFKDVKPTAWYYAELSYAVERGMINGTSNTAFSPNTAITQGMFLTIVGRAINVDDNTTMPRTYPDVKQDWYKPYVAWALRNNILPAASSTRYGVDDPISRADMAMVMSKTISYVGKDVAVANTGSSAYRDASSIPNSYKTYVEDCYKYGIMTGDSAGKFNPKNGATRAEGTAVLVRMDKLLAAAGESGNGGNENDIVISPSPEPSPEPSEHVHNFLLTDGKARTRYKTGWRLYTCECGETYTETIPKAPAGQTSSCTTNTHIIYLAHTIPATASSDGTRIYTCDTCGAVYKTTIKKITDDVYASYNSSINYSAAKRWAQDYAVSLGFGVLDEDMDWDNSSYYGETWAAQYSSYDELITAIKSSIDYLASRKTADGVLLNVVSYNCLIKETKDPLSGNMLTMVASAH